MHSVAPESPFFVFFGITGITDWRNQIDAESSFARSNKYRQRDSRHLFTNSNLRKGQHSRSAAINSAATASDFLSPGYAKEVTVDEFFGCDRGRPELNETRWLRECEVPRWSDARYRNLVDHIFTCPADSKPTTNVALPHQPR